MEKERTFILEFFMFHHERGDNSDVRMDRDSVNKIGPRRGEYDCLRQSVQIFGEYFLGQLSVLSKKNQRNFRKYSNKNA